MEPGDPIPRRVLRRLQPSPSDERAWLGPLSLEIAYEHNLGLNRLPTSRALAIAGVPETSPWLDLQWNLWERDQVSWEHRFDRLNLSWAPTGSLDLTLGRQTVSWATTLFLTPADPFSPFNPADPFRAYRGGVDAARLQFHPGPLSRVEVVVRPTRTAAGREITALGRGLTTWKNWEVSGWAGALFDELPRPGRLPARWARWRCAARPRCAKSAARPG